MPGNPSGGPQLPDLPEQTRPTVGKVLPWLGTGEDRDTLAELGAQLSVALRDLAVTGKPRGGLLRTAQQLQAMANRIQAAQLAVIAEFDRTADQPSNVPLELSLGLAISKHTAQSQIGLAQALITRLPNTLEAMRRGEIDSWKASRVYEPTAVLSDEKAREVDAIMATRIAGKDPAGLRRSVNRAVAKVDPDGHAERCAQRRAQRRVELIPMDDGMVNLSSYLPAEVGVAVAGMGIIPAWLARHIATGPNTTLRRLITDPDTGQILSVGRDRYRPPAPLTRLIHSRDRECRIPTCHRPAQHCETDHVDDWHALNGSTEDTNLTALCTRDHHTKDFPGWSYHLDKETGTFTITTPTNDQYTSNPEPLHPPRTNPFNDEPPDDPRFQNCLMWTLKRSHRSVRDSTSPYPLVGTVRFRAAATHHSHEGTRHGQRGWIGHRCRAHDRRRIPLGTRAKLLVGATPRGRAGSPRDLLGRRG